MFSLLSRQYETVVPLEDSVVTEVTATLQEWAVLWKQLYVVRTVPFSLYSVFQAEETHCMHSSPIGKNNKLRIVKFILSSGVGVPNCGITDHMNFKWAVLEISAVFEILPSELKTS